MTLQNSSQNQLENLEDLYELSPMQQGMLFHSIYSPDSGTYFEQSLFTIKGALDFAAFEGAWQRLLQRHSILRTSFIWEELEKPLQAVYRQVDLPLTTQDWRELPPEERELRLQSFIKTDRSRGFELSKAPLVRLALFRFSDDECKFVFSRHHLVLDRWSRSLLLKDLFAAYHALSEGREPSFDVTRPYVDYIRWLASQDANAAERFWRKSLAGFTEPTSLGIERSTDERADRYADQRVQLSEDASARLSGFARQQRLTLNTLVQGAWALLLSRYSGDDDVLFGVTVAGRPAALTGAESIVGLFINTLPLRVRVPSGVTVLAWLNELQTQQSQLQQFEYSSLIDIQGWSDVPRGVPLFDSILVFENLPVGSSYQAENKNVEFRDDRGIGSTTGYPLTVLVSPGRRLTIQIVYDVGRYTDEAIQTLLNNLETLFESLPSAAETVVSRVPLLTAAEREQILVKWNDTAVPSAHVSIVKRFEEQVEKTPDAVALICDDQELSYRELHERADQLANHLRTLGIGAEARVGICIDRSVEMLLGVLATLKAGGAYVPLDPEYPHDRLRFMLQDAQCPVLLTNERLLVRLPETGSTVICLDRPLPHDLAVQQSPKTEIHGHNLTYLMYTSGSTGEPKSVAMTERALANLISWQLDQSDAPARTLQFASLSFDVSFQEIFSTWCSGGTLLLVSDELRRDAASLLSFLAEQKVQRIFLPFVALQNLAVAAEHSDISLEHLKEIITAGEQLEITPQISKFLDRMKDCSLHNHYGPSESHVVTAHSLHPPVSSWPTLPPVGRPIANTQIYILDKHLEPTPIGVPGQLCIAGANLARGYLNRPSLTAEKFVPNPFGSPGTRLYLTGDLARYQRDGTIEFLGRIDNQVKIRGFRVELGEIETMLATHPSVREAVVVAREDVKGDRKLVGYVVPSGKDFDSAVMRTYLKERLPDYMVPGAFVVIDALPLTPSGKINRRALASLVPSEIETAHKYEAPRDATEEKLAEIWAAVLRRERVGISDNFFELGGHSLMATQLISRVRSAFEVELPLRNLFESPTVAELAGVIVRLQAEVKTLPPSTITRHTSGEAAELLTRLDQLSDEDVDSLLREAMADSGNNE